MSKLIFFAGEINSDVTLIRAARGVSRRPPENRIQHARRAMGRFGWRNKTGRSFDRPAHILCLPLNRG
jgi:hypothetical protein